MNAFCELAPTSRVAVLVDGENVSAAHAEAIRTLAAGLGLADTQRVYGDVAQLGAWQTEPGFRIIHSGTGKNAADLLLCLDALEMALDGGYRTVLIASSDGDFTHLAQRLRDRGVAVIGVGANAPARFRLACNRYETLVLRAVSTSTDRAERPSPTDQRIRAIIRERGVDGSGLRVTELNGLMAKRHAFRIGDTQERTWRGYLQSRSRLYSLDASSKDARVRYLPAGFATA